MPNQQRIVTDDDHRVIQFRPRNAARSLTASQVSQPAPQTVPICHPRATTRDALPSPRATASYVGTAPQPESMEPHGERPQGRPSPVDYRQRMIVNVIALVFILFLTGASVWVVATIKDLRRTQNCLLIGRRDCAQTLLAPVTPIAKGWQSREGLF
jgi:hypothetical protein